MLGTPLKVLFFLNVTYMLHFAFSLNLVVELAIAEMVVSHPSSRVRAHSPAKLHTVKFCFPEYPHDSFRVPYGVPVQRSISERDVLHPSCLI